MPTSYVSPDSIITTFAGDMKAGDYAAFFGVNTTGAGLVPVPSSTPVLMPGGQGNYMTAGSIEYYTAHPANQGEGKVSTQPVKNDGQGGNTDPNAGQSEAVRQQNAIEYAKSNFQWAYAIGLAPVIEDAVKRGVGAEGIVAELRNSQPYKQRFVAINRDDGTMRMSEAQYMQQEDSYRNLLREYGHATDDLSNPTYFATLFNNEIDPNELKTRLDTYSQIQRSGQSVKDAFYVYAGMKINDDDLYTAVVDPGANQKLLQEFNQRVAAQPIDYQTWITRATEAGLARTADTLSNLQKQGVVGAAATQSLSQVDPTIAREIMAQLASGTTGAPDGTRTLSLDELQNAFQYALLGSAATDSGLRMPSQNELEQLRQAGVSRAKALQGFGDIAAHQNLYAGELSRAGLQSMDETDLENAVLAGQGDLVDRLKRAQGFEDSLGQSTGFAAFQRSKSGLLQQQGLTPIGQ